MWSSFKVDVVTFIKQYLHYMDGKVVPPSLRLLGEVVDGTKVKRCHTLTSPTSGQVVVWGQ